MANTVIQEGDTLVKLALRLGVPVSVLLDLNPELATSLIVGTSVRLPDTPPKRVGSTVAPTFKLPAAAPTTGAGSFIQEFGVAYATFLETVTDPRIHKFMAGEQRDIEQEYLGKIGRAFLEGKISSPTAVGEFGVAGLDPLSFLRGIDPLARFYQSSPFERGTGEVLPGPIRPRRVRF